MENMRKRILLTALAVASVSACSETLDIEPQEVYKLLPNVYCVLRPEASRQWLMLERTMQMTESAKDVYAGRLWGARVVIDSDGGRVEFAEKKNEPGMYYSDSLTVVPGRRYELTVIDRYQNVVTGETVVPEPIRIIEPRPGVYEPGVRLWLEWTESPSAARYVTYVRPYRAEGWGEPYYLTSSEPYLTLEPRILPYPGDYLIEVMALDENYYNYSLTSNRSEATQDLLTLKGGLGLFGSAAADTVRIAIGRSFLSRPR
jgi:hypothetical protein